MNQNFLLEQLLIKFPDANNEEALAYLKHVCVNETKSKPKEFHHILPVSHFPEFKTARWNKMPLSPRNHYYAHLMLANLLQTEQMIFALNQLRRVSKKEGSGVTEEEISLNFEKFRIKLSETISKNNTGFFSKLPEEEQRELRKKVSERTKKTIVVRYLDSGLRKRLPLDHEDIISGKAIFDSYGRKHTEETKQKMSISGSSELKGDVYSNTITGEIKHFKEEDIIPDGFIRGLLFMREVAKARFKNKIIASNEEGVQIRVYEHEIPEGFSKKRTNFGKNGNFFQHNVILYHILTGDKLCNPTGNDIPPYYRLSNQKKLYRFKNEITAKRPCYCNEVISISNKERLRELIDICFWVDKLNLPKRKTGTKCNDQVCGFIIPEV